VDDRRSLGVLAGQIKLYQAGQSIDITTHLDDATLSGWQNQEASPCRWTNGYVALPLDTGTTDTVLAIQILAAGPYLAARRASQISPGAA